jgi:hypothetical protein
MPVTCTSKIIKMVNLKSCILPQIKEEIAHTSGQGRGERETGQGREKYESTEASCLENVAVSDGK